MRARSVFYDLFPPAEAKRLSRIVREDLARCARTGDKPMSAAQFEARTKKKHAKLVKG